MKTRRNGRVGKLIIGRAAAFYYLLQFYRSLAYTSAPVPSRHLLMLAADVHIAFGYFYTTSPNSIGGERVLARCLPGPRRDRPPNCLRPVDSADWMAPSLNGSVRKAV
jgi:hypothetical protein